MFADAYISSLATCEDKGTFLLPKYNTLFKNIFFVSLIWSQWAFFKQITLQV